jgi:prolyl oligopeptidase
MRLVFSLLLTFLIVSISMPPMPVEAQENASNDAARQLQELFTSEWDYRMREFPTDASQLGDRRWNDRWPDMTLDAIRKRQEHYVEALARLSRINRATLSRQDQLNYDLFKREYEETVEAFRYRLYLLPLNQREGIQTAYDLSTALRFETVKDYDDWIARLRAFPAYMDQTIELMRTGIKERIMWPKVVMQRVPAQIDKQITTDPQASLFYKPFQSFPDTIPAAERLRLAKAAREAITSNVVPAYQKLKEFFARDYLPASYDRVGASEMPQGKEMYAFLARRNTTTSLTPAEIHEKGLTEVKRIRAEMQSVMDRVGFKGTLQEFFKFLRTDRRFYYQTPEELYEAYQAMSKSIDPKLVKVFKTLPRMPYGVDPIPAAIAPDTTTAYYRQPAADGSRAGTYFVNLYKPESRPKYEMMALSLHEAVPGHHLQIALAFELGEMPNFRRYGGYTAFIEGWGLYAESLGDDMGLYEDPYAKFGQLTYEMWRAVRLVVDTGMHNMGWDRQRAIDFFLDNAAKSEQDIVNEIDRYISDPGQALAYKIGQLKIKELRERAARELGARFDLREFHDVVLLSGAVPLDVLERNVDEWIERNKRSTK